MTRDTSAICLANEWRIFGLSSPGVGGRYFKITVVVVAAITRSQSYQMVRCERPLYFRYRTEFTILVSYSSQLWWPLGGGASPSASY